MLLKRRLNTPALTPSGADVFPLRPDLPMRCRFHRVVPRGPAVRRGFGGSGSHAGDGEMVSLPGDRTDLGRNGTEDTTRAERQALETIAHRRAPFRRGTGARSDSRSSKTGACIRFRFPSGFLTEGPDVELMRADVSPNPKVGMCWLSVTRDVKKVCRRTSRSRWTRSTACPIGRRADGNAPSTVEVTDDLLLFDLGSWRRATSFNCLASSDENSLGEARSSRAA